MNDSLSESVRLESSPEHKDLPACVRKRNGSLVDFDEAKIIFALTSAGAATGEFAEEKAKALAQQVLAYISSPPVQRVLSVEQIIHAIERIFQSYCAGVQVLNQVGRVGS